MILYQSFYEKYDYDDYTRIIIYTHTEERECQGKEGREGGEIFFICVLVGQR